MDAPWCRAPTAVQSCASLKLYPCVATAFLGIMPATGVWEQAGSCSHQYWTDLQSAMAPQPFILHPSKMPFSTNTYQRVLGGTFAGYFLACSLFLQGLKWWVSGGLGQLHTLLAASTQSPGAVVVTLGVDHEKDFWHLIFAAQLLSF